MLCLYAIDDQRYLLITTQFKHVLFDLEMDSPIGLAGKDGVLTMADFLATPKVNIVRLSIDQVNDTKMAFECPLVFLVAFVFIG